MSAEALLAAVVLLACVAALARMALGERRRQRLDASLQHHARQLSQRGRALWRQRRLSGQARREADDLIQRARRVQPGADRDGNVVRPHAFGTRGRDAGAHGPKGAPPAGGADFGSGREQPPDGRGRRDH
jgi:hypothetical protein